MWRSSFRGCAAVLASAILISACTNDSKNSTEPLSPGASGSLVSPACPSVTQTANMINPMFPKGTSRTSAAQQYSTIVSNVNAGRSVQATALMFTLLDFTLQQYNAGKLIDGYTLESQQRVLAFETGLYCTVGLTPTGLVLPGDPTTGGTVDKVVYPNTTTQNTVTPNGHAGVQFPGGTLLGPVLVTITPLTGDPPLHTNLRQYGPFSDVKVSPETNLGGDVSVGICPSAAVVPPSVYLAHNNSATTIEVLPHGNFIPGLCGVFVPPTSLRQVYDLGRNGDFASAAKLVGSAVANMLLPTDANATGGGITGTTRTFSPFGGVDTEVMPYGSSYLYSSGTHDFDANFGTTDFTTTNWLTANGPFGTGDLNGTVCAINSDVNFVPNQQWPLGTDLLLLKTFTLTGVTTPLTVTAAIDNDIKIFVNGHALTTFQAISSASTGTYAFDASTGFVTHEDCANKGSLLFTIPNAFLNSGSPNTIAVRARDRGIVNYVDLQVTVAAPAQP